MDWDADSLENLYYAIGALVVAYLVFNGWRQGVVRQLMTLLAITCAYAVGIFGSGAVAPLFGFLRYPEPLPRVIGGAVAGLVTFLVISTFSRTFFKKTAEKPQGRARLNYGIFGAVLGLVFGLAAFFAASEAVRLLGAIAQSNKQVSGNPANPSQSVEQSAPVSPVISGIAKLSGALNDGGSGDFFKKVDPVPAHVFVTLTKLGRMVSRPEAMERFNTYPGIERLTSHPKLLDLQSDPEVTKLIVSQSYFRLLRHRKVVALASDPEFSAEIRAIDWDKAFDHALKAPGQRAAVKVPPVKVAPVEVTPVEEVLPAEPPGSGGSSGRN